MTSTTPLVSVIIPAFNEEQTLGSVLDRLGALPAAGWDWEFVVVDDGSQDRTPEIAEAWSPAAKKQVLAHARNRGKGAALRTGFAAARGEVIVVQDADLEYDPEQLALVLRPILASDADVVFGTRFSAGRPPGMRRANYLGNRSLSLVTRLLFGGGVEDMETCYKAFRSEFLLGLPLTADRFDIEPELTGWSLRRGARFRQVPISYDGRTHDEGKKITWRDGVAALGMLMRVRLARDRRGATR